MLVVFLSFNNKRIQKFVLAIAKLFKINFSSCNYAASTFLTYFWSNDYFVLMRFYMLLNDLIKPSKPVSFDFYAKQLGDWTRFRELLREESVPSIKKKGQRFNRKILLRKGTVTVLFKSFSNSINLTHKGGYYSFLGVLINSTFVTNKFFKANFLIKKSICSTFFTTYLLLIYLNFICLYSIFRSGLAVFLPNVNQFLFTRHEWSTIHSLV